MNAIIFAFCSGILGALFSLSYKLRVRLNYDADNVLLGFSFSALAITFCLHLFLAEFIFSMSLLLLGTAFGISMITSITLYLAVTRRTKLNITWTIIQFCVIIPFALSIILYGEKPSLFSWLGIAFIFIAIIVFGLGKRSKSRQATVPDIKTAFLLLLATLLTGVSLSLPKIFAMVSPQGEIVSLLLYSCLTMVILSSSFYLFRKQFNKKDRPARIWKPGFLLFSAYMSLTNMSAAAVLILALREIPGSIVFPLRNAVSIISVFVFSFLFFKEKANLLEITGSVIAVSGIVIVSGSF